MSRRRNDGLSAKIRAGSCGRMPRTLRRFTCPQSPKAAENQYYIHVAAASQRAIRQNRSAILRANALHNSPPNNPHQPKATHFHPSPSKGPFYVAKQWNRSCGGGAVARAAEPGLRKVNVTKLLDFPFRLP